MTPERYQQIKELALQAAEQAQSHHAAFLDLACAGDEELRREVEARIIANERADLEGFISIPGIARFAELLIPVPSGATTGDKPMILNGRYLIPDPGQPFKEGGFGKVYLAQDLNLHSRQVIVKTLKPTNDRKTDEYIKQKFHGDIDALTRFRHPNLIGILDQGTLPGSGDPFFVMDWIEGESLRDAMKRGRLDFARIARIIHQAGRALSYAHERGVYHRDLKPDNLMLRREDDSVVIIDFGIATVQEWKQATRGAATDKTMLVGTAEYMAPEQIRGKPEAASDIWALDVISFELLTGQLPFTVPRDTNSGQVQWRRLSELHQSGVGVSLSVLCPQLPAAVESVIRKSLAFDPPARHSEARQFGEALAVALMAAQPDASSQPATEIISGPTAEITEPLNGNVFSPGAASAVSPVHSLQSLQSLRSIASPTNRIQPRLVSEAKVRGMGGKPGNSPRRFRQGDRLRLVIDSDWEGHLLLLDEGPEGIVYCLCPSLFAPDTRLRREPIGLPQSGACVDAFEITGDASGREHLLAIVSDAPLGLDWLPRDPQQPARVLTQNDINVLLARLRGLDRDRWMVLSAYFDVVA